MVFIDVSKNKSSCAEKKLVPDVPIKTCIFCIPSSTNTGNTKMSSCDDAQPIINNNNPNETMDLVVVDADPAPAVTAGQQQKQHEDNRMQVVQHPPVDLRDPDLKAFEGYLLQNLRQTDVVKDQEEGVYLFNVNQVAYLVEESTTEDSKRATRIRVAKGIDQLHHQLRHSAGTNKGKKPIFNFQTEKFFF